MRVNTHKNMRQHVCHVRWLVSAFTYFFVQEVVNVTLLEKVKTSIERSKSLRIQMLDIGTRHGSVVDAVLDGAHGNTSLKKLTIQLIRYLQFYPYQ